MSNRIRSQLLALQRELLGFADRLNEAVEALDAPEEMLTVEEAAKEINLSQHRLRLKINDGLFPGAVKQGRSWSIPRADVDAYKASGKTAQDILHQKGMS